VPTDLHCHILPGVDDGPRTIGEAVALALKLVAGGVERVVATPHVNLSIPTEAATMRERLDELRAELERHRVPLVVEPGAEVAASYLPNLDATELAALTLGGGRWILLEPPMNADFPIEAAVASVHDAGHEVLLAHPERCRLFQRDLDRLAALVGEGARVSVTAGSFTGHFGRQVRAVAQRLVKADLVHNAVSDAHSVIRRPPRLLADLEAAHLADRVPAWCEELPARILGD